MSDVNTVQPPRKLPLGEMISLSYSWFFRKFPDVLRICWLWLLICAALIGWANWVQWSWIAPLMAGVKGGLPAQALVLQASPIWRLLPVNLAGLVVMFAAVSIAVAWHRRIILREPPGLSGSNIVTQDLWRYIGIGILIWLIVIVPVAAILVSTGRLLLPAVLIGSSDAPARIGLFLLLLVSLYVASIAVLLRLCMLLPARASGDIGLTFRGAWKRTRGNTWRLFWGLLACTLAPMIMIEIVLVIALPPTGMLPFKPSPAAALDGPVALTMTVMSTVLSVIYLLILPIGIGFLSHAYRHFFPDGLKAAD